MLNTLDLSLVSVWSGHVTTRPNFKQQIFALISCIFNIPCQEFISSSLSIICSLDIFNKGAGKFYQIHRALVDALMAKLISLKVEENKVLVFSIRAELSVLVLKQLTLIPIQYHLWASFLCHKDHEAVFNVVMVTNGVSFWNQM